MAVGSGPHLSVTNRRAPAQIEMFIVQPLAYIAGKITTTPPSKTLLGTVVWQWLDSSISLEKGTLYN